MEEQDALLLRDFIGKTKPIMLFDSRCPQHKEITDKIIFGGILFQKRRRVFPDGSYFDWKLYKGRSRGFKFWLAKLYVRMIPETWKTRICIRTKEGNLSPFKYIVDWLSFNPKPTGRELEIFLGKYEMDVRTE